MAGFGDLFVGYGLETEWLLTWFPVKEGAPLDGPKMRGGFFKHNITDFADPGALGGGTGEGHRLSDDFKNNSLFAAITIGRDANFIYQAEIEVTVGTNRRQKYLQLLPGTVTPFMVNVAAGGNRRETTGTALVLQGVFTAGERASVASIFVSGLFGK
jgi:hypothetical protein